MKNNGNKAFLTAYLSAVCVLAVALLLALSAFGFYLRANDGNKTFLYPEVRDAEKQTPADENNGSVSLDAAFLYEHLDEPLSEFEDLSAYESYVSSLGETKLVKTGEREYTVVTDENVKVADFTMPEKDKRSPSPEYAESVTAYVPGVYTVTAAVLPESELFVNDIAVSDKYKVKNDGVYGIYAVDGLAAEPKVTITTDGRECAFKVDEHGQYIEDYATVEKLENDTVLIDGEPVECYVVKNGIDSDFETVRVTGFAEISDITVESGEPAVGENENGGENENAENDEALAAEYSELAESTAKAIANYIANDISLDEAARNIDPSSELYRLLRLQEVNWFTDHTDNAITNGKSGDFAKLSDTEFSCRYTAVQTITLSGGNTVDIPIDFTLYFHDTESGPLAYDFKIN